MDEIGDSQIPRAGYTPHEHLGAAGTSPGQQLECLRIGGPVVADHELRSDPLRFALDLGQRLLQQQRPVPRRQQHDNLNFGRRSHGPSRRFAGRGILCDALGRNLDAAWSFLCS